MKRWLTVALLMSACTDSRGNLTIDVGALVTQAAQVNLSIERFTLTITGPGIDTPIVESLDPDDPVFDVAVPAGPSRLFVVEAVTAEDLPVYWGEQRADVSPRFDQELVIPAFPAGRVEVTLDTVGIERRPERVPVELVAQSPRDDQRPRFLLDLGVENVRQTLPTGEYAVEPGVIDNREALLLIPSQSVVVLSQAESTRFTLTLATADSCNPALGITPDLDRDGLACDVDCDDTNPSCGTDCTDQDEDGFCVDFDCDDSPDGGAECQVSCPTLYEDRDGDGFGADATAVVRCSPPTGFITTAGDCDDSLPFCSESCIDADEDVHCGANDCDDTNARVNRSALEVAGDGIDSDCDGQELCYVDDDLDGDGDRSKALVASADVLCATAGVSRSGNDCDDADDALSFVDRDGDGYISCVAINGLDCDETNPDIHSEKVERCNDGIDNDCDGLIDLFDGECAALLDMDGDGYNESFLPVDLKSVDCPTGDSSDADNDGWTSCEGDCDDSDSRINPGAPLRCTLGVEDSNCDGTPDAIECLTCVDLDGDGYCEADECDDSDPARNLDDLDRDGYTTCSEPVAECDDTWFLAPIPEIGALEFCFDGRDNDCDGLIDAADDDCACPDNDGDGFSCVDCDDDPSTGPDCFTPDSCIDLPTDLDGDLFFDPSAGTRSTCSNALRLGEDCDDSDPSVNPGALEICGNGVDDNCSELGSLAEDDFDLDQDGDGFFAASCGGDDCDDLDPKASPGDFDGDGVDGCLDPNDLDASVFPTAPELCDGVDNDGDGVVDNFVVDDADADQDDDGVPDCSDNCVSVANPEPSVLQPPPQRIRLAWLRNFEGSTGEAIQWSIFINGTLVDSVSDDTPLSCPSSPVFQDVVSGSFPWSGDGSDSIRVEGSDPASPETVAWMTIGLDDGLDPIDFELPYFGDFDALDACSSSFSCGGSNCPSDETFIPVPGASQDDTDSDGVGDACDCNVAGNAGAIPECPSGCSVDQDQDGDGFYAAGGSCTPPPDLVDCDDSLDTGPLVSPAIPYETECDPNGFQLDEDCDGLTDLQDPDCFGFDASAPQPVFVPLDQGASGAVGFGRFDLCTDVLEGGSICGGPEAEAVHFEVRLNDPQSLGDELEIFNGSEFEVSIELDAGTPSCLVAGIAPGTSYTFSPTSQASSLIVRPASGPRCGNGTPFLDLAFRYVDFDGVSSFDDDRDGIDDLLDPCIDVDGDGFGRSDSIEQSCPAGNPRDCDDFNPSAFPGGEEVCDGADNDCDGQVDEGFITSVLVEEDFEGESPLTRTADPWTTTAVSGSEVDWQLVTSTADGGVTFPSTWLGTDGAFSGAPEDSAVETAPFSFSPGAAILLQFDSYTANEGGCPGVGSDGEELEVDTGGGWASITPCPYFPLNSAFDSAVRRLTVPVPVGETAGNARVRWRFDSGPDTFSSRDGWYIDNVRIYACTPE